MNASEASEQPQEVGALVGPVGEMETQKSKHGVSVPEGPGQGGQGWAWGPRSSYSVDCRPWRPGCKAPKWPLGGAAGGSREIWWCKVGFWDIWVWLRFWLVWLGQQFSLFFEILR